MDRSEKRRLSLPPFLLRFSFIEKGDEQVITYQADRERCLSGEDFGAEKLPENCASLIERKKKRRWATIKRESPLVETASRFDKRPQRRARLDCGVKNINWWLFNHTSLNFLKSSSSLPPPLYLSFLKDWVSSGSSSSGGIYGSGASQLVMGKLACFCWLKFKWATQCGEVWWFLNRLSEWVNQWVWIFSHKPGPSTSSKCILAWWQGGRHSLHNKHILMTMEPFLMYFEPLI